MSENDGEPYLPSAVVCIYVSGGLTIVFSGLLAPFLSS